MSGKHWTKEEEGILEDMIGTFTAASIARKLGRSFNSVNLKLSRMGLSGFEGSTDLLTMNIVHKMMGVEARTIKGKWADAGLRTIRKGNYVCIRQEDLIKFLKNNPDLWNAHKVKDDTLLMGYDWYKEKRKVDMPSNYNWTPIEVSRMKLLRNEGYSIREIAEKMKRSESSIKYKLYSRR